MLKDKLIWSEEAPPTNGISYYNHIISEKTPLGVFMIEWKSWKESPDYSIVLDDDYIDVVYSLEEAKKIALDYLKLKNKELTEFLNKDLKKYIEDRINILSSGDELKSFNESISDNNIVKELKILSEEYLNNLTDATL